MPAERFIYALADWTVEKREQGWYFARSAGRMSANRKIRKRVDADGNDDATAR
jgi:hypothetical protein